jgi:hypothetical protein
MGEGHYRVAKTSTQKGSYFMKIALTSLRWLVAGIAAATLASCETASPTTVGVFKSSPATNSASEYDYLNHPGMTTPSTQLQ